MIKDPTLGLWCNPGGCNPIQNQTLTASVTHFLTSTTHLNAFDFWPHMKEFDTIIAMSALWHLLGRYAFPTSGGTKSFYFIIIIIIFFFLWGTEGANCISEGAKFFLKCQKWLIYAIFCFWWGEGVKWGADPPTGEQMHPHAPLSAATVSQTCHFSLDIAVQITK